MICPLLSINREKAKECNYKCAWYRHQSQCCTLVTVAEYIKPFMSDIWKQSGPSKTSVNNIDGSDGQS